MIILSDKKRIKELEKALAERDELIRTYEIANQGQKAEIERLADELHLEKAWAEGEIDFWQGESTAGDMLIDLLQEELAKKNKPWWRYIIS